MMDHIAKLLREINRLHEELQGVIERNQPQTGKAHDPDRAQLETELRRIQRDLKNLLDLCSTSESSVPPDERETLNKALDELQNDLVKLNKWKDSLDHAIPEPKSIGEEFRFWRRSLRTVQWVIGIAGVTLLTALGAAIVATVKGIDDKLKTASERVDKRIEDLVKENVLADKAAKQVSKQLSQEMRDEFADTYATTTAELIANAKLMFRMPENGKTAGVVFNTLNLREHAVLVEDLEQAYAVKLAAGKLPAQTQKALVQCLNGIIESAKGHVSGRGVTATTWYEVAARTDPEMPEPHVLLGMVHALNVRFNGTDFVPKEELQHAGESFSKAYHLQEASGNQTALLTLCRAMAVGMTEDNVKNGTLEIDPTLGALKGIVESITKIIDGERARGGIASIDARFYSALGLAQLRVAILLTPRAKSSSDPAPEIDSVRKKLIEDWQRKALESFLLAHKHDPTYTRALNNSIVLMTHDAREEICYPLMDDGEILKVLDAERKNTSSDAAGERSFGLFRLLLEGIEHNPFFKEDSTLLNTAGEAYAALLSGREAKPTSEQNEPPGQMIPADEKDSWKSRALQYTQRAYELAALTGAREAGYLQDRAAAVRKHLKVESQGK